MTALFTTETFAATVSTLVETITNASKARGKIAAAFKDAAAPAYGDLALQGQVADLMTTVRRELLVAESKYVTWLSRNGQAAAVDAYKKANINALAYAAKCAGEAAGCKFAWDRVKRLYSVSDLKAANEPEQASAAGKDANSAEQAAAIVEAAQVAPVQTEAQKRDMVRTAMQALIQSGVSLAMLESVVHGLALEAAAAATADDAAAAATAPKAPAILAEKLAAHPAFKKGRKTA